MTEPEDPREPPDEFLSVGEVAAMMHVSPRTVSRWAREGRIAALRTLGGHHRFSRRAIEALLANPPEA